MTINNELIAWLLAIVIDKIFRKIKIDRYQSTEQNRCMPYSSNARNSRKLVVKHAFSLPKYTQIDIHIKIRAHIKHNLCSSRIINIISTNRLMARYNRRELISIGFWYWWYDSPYTFICVCCGCIAYTPSTHVRIQTAVPPEDMWVVWLIATWFWHVINSNHISSHFILHRNSHTMELFLLLSCIVYPIYVRIVDIDFWIGVIRHFCYSLFHQYKLYC